MEGRVQTATDVGDAADGVQLAEQIGLTERRIAELDELLHGTVPASGQDFMLPDGTEVTVRFSDGEVVTLRVISVVEQMSRAEDDTLTADSPLGLALAGRQPGERVVYLAPRGEQHVDLLALKLPE